MTKGEVWRVRIPFAPGHTQTGERPAVVVQDNPSIATLPTVLIVPITGTLAAARFDGTLLVHPDAHNGLTIPSVALIFQLRALDKRQFQQRLGALDTTTMDQIFTLLDKLTGR